ncbi:MAG: zinc ribbon-containing (seleno)protein DG [Thermodesulfobacteriota bacterium]
MFDPEFKYCPKCRDEYRANVEYCAECGIRLLTGEEMAAATGKGSKNVAGPVELTPSDDIVPVQQGDIKELKGTAAALKKEGIASILIGKEEPGCCVSPGAYLAVRREDVPEAGQIVRHYWEQTTGFSTYDTSSCEVVFNKDAGEATCPACGSNFQTHNGTCPNCGLCL